jgi:hypothetical protein
LTNIRQKRGSFDEYALRSPFATSSAATRRERVARIRARYP